MSPIAQWLQYLYGNVVPFILEPVDQQHKSQDAIEASAPNERANTQICPVLQKDLDLLRHVLVKETDDHNVIFTPYLIKKHRKDVNKEAYKTSSKGAPSPPN